MIKLQTKLPRELYVACSGGVDSMAILDFLRRNHNVTVAFFNHMTPTSDRALNFVADYCTQEQIPMLYGVPKNKRDPKQSWEEYWRTERYNFLHSFAPLGIKVVTAHHLDDCVETWVWSSLHGEGKIIPYNYRNVIRPFRLTRKRDLELWCQLKNVPWIEDETNADTKHTRNYIRHKMMPHVLRVNPGIHKTVAKKVQQDVLEEFCQDID